ncbi:MAG: M1 family metallopeptidase [Planctomycetota bacterium]
MIRSILAFLAIFSGTVALAQPLTNSKHSDPIDLFYQIDQWWPTPNDQRTASGAPGPEYWQQRADYDIDVTLDDEKQTLTGVSRITYHNRSPHPLPYVWVQLDQNRFKPDSDSAMIQPAPTLAPRASFRAMNSIFNRMIFDGGYKIPAVTDANSKPLDHVIVKTMMRIDLDEPLLPGESTEFHIQFSFNIVDSKMMSARGGHEYFEKDGNYIYEMAQWFPRVVSYTDYTGWQHKQFLGRGEFTLELGDYVVRITVPDDMVVTATGELQNSEEVMEPEWIERLEESKSVKKPMFIVTPEEAKKNEEKGSDKTETWVFAAKNVRDFAFAASRKFIWDSMGVDVDGQTVMAMSFYPNEAEPLWSQYSTEAIVHTLEVYGRYSFAYPYPVAISVNGPVYGMEYPMICFNGPRPEEDGTYSKSTKYGLISVVIHEVGHNFFPMIVNSDERQWTWMDEGLNSFLQYLAEQEWEEDYPSRRGDPERIVPYMRGNNQRPIMTGSEEVLQFGDNAYGKPATALNILRETILGRELFDFAFREYARRWKFKRPTPADFFRTMEDASGIDLDWFWRGWFYSTDHVDLAIADVQLYQIDAGDPDEAAERRRKELDEKEPTLSKQRNEELRKRIDWQPGLKDFYNSPDYDELAVEESARKAYQKMLEGLDPKQRAMLKRTTNFYVIDFENIGGLVMPVIMRVHYTDNTSEMVTFPVQSWRKNSKSIRKLWVTDKEVARMELDPRRETADTDMSNNHWPEKMIPSRFQLYKSSRRGGSNPMSRFKAKEAKEAKERAAKEKAEEKTKEGGDK